MDKSITVLCVDDEIDILMVLKRCFRGTGYNVIEANSGHRALEILECTHVDIIISDMRMPCMTGVELLSSVYQKWPHIYRILLTGYADLNSLSDAINQGKVSCYLEKPWDNKNLLAAMDVAVEEVLAHRQNDHLKEQVFEQNQRLALYKSKLEEKILQRTRQVKSVLHKNQRFTADLYKVLHNFVCIHPDLSGEFANVVSRTASNFANYCELSSTEINDIGLAGQMCEIGLLGIDSGIYTRPFDKLSYREQQMYFSQVNHIHALLSPAQPLNSVEELLSDQFEYIDGSGFPEGKTISDIPIGSRILAIARDFWRYKLGRISAVQMSNDEAIVELKKYRDTRYDGALLDLFLQHRPWVSENVKEKGVNVDSLCPGMILTEDLYGQKYMLLLPKGHILTQKCILKLKRLERFRGAKISLVIDNTTRCSPQENVG